MAAKNYTDTNLSIVRRIYTFARKHPNFSHIFSFVYPILSRYERKKYFDLSSSLKKKYGQKMTVNLKEYFGLSRLNFSIEFDFGFLDEAILFDTLSRGDIYERGVTNYILNNFRDGDIFLDVGANIGYFTLLAASLSKSGKIYSVEANPKVYQRLLNNIQINGFTNVFAFNVAAGNTNLVTPMDEKGGLFAHGTIVSEKDASLLADGTVKVEMRRLDDILGPPVSLIKMDVEGAEPLALQGMKNILNQPVRPALIIEFNPGYNTKMLIQQLPEKSYIGVIDDNEGVIQIGIPELFNLRNTVNLLVLPDNTKVGMER